MSVEIREEFAAELRAMLVEQARASGARGRRRWGWRTAGVKVMFALAVIVTGGGAAAATGVLPIPGSTVTTRLGAAVTVTGSGTQTIGLGAPPQGADAIGLAFRCLTSGSFVFADGSSETCSQADAQHAAQLTATLPLALGQHRTVITAGAGERWQASVFYASVARLPYKTNADGQTYGSAGGAPGGPANEPDLIAVQATNGKAGYAYASQLNGRTPTSPAQAIAENNQPARMIPVYESDGKTRIGEFNAGS